MGQTHREHSGSFGPRGLKVLAIVSLAMLLPTTGQLCGTAGGSFWQLTGNAGTDPNTDFLGTTDDQALEVRLNNERVLRIEPADNTAFSGSNHIAGFSGNSVLAGMVGATIGGGGGIDKNGNVPLVNRVNSNFGTVAGGHSNTAGSTAGTVGGGTGNSAGGPFATVPGGKDNSAPGSFTFAAGRQARALHDGSFVWADSGAGASPVPTFSSDRADQFSVRAAGGVRIEKVSGTTSLGTSNAALHTETFFTNGEAAWLRTANPQAFAVLKLNRHPGGTSNYVEGIDYDGTTATRKFHIDQNGTFIAGSDFAEALPATGPKSDYEPGDVLVLTGDRPGAVEKCRKVYDAGVVGVYSTRPGLLGADKDGQTRLDGGDLPVAITGIVPTKVTAENGPIRPRDLLTTSSTPGRAMKAKPRLVDGTEIYPTGTIVGKAMEPLKQGTGVIRVLIILK
jgi:hypothetical protein